jgi:uncharacterized RDD family membrane protein YckC
MNCRHCDHWNPEDEQRCRLCGRKLQLSADDSSAEWRLTRVAGNLAVAPQHSLFPSASNVIPFETLPGARPAPRSQVMPLKIEAAPKLDPPRRVAPEPPRQPAVPRPQVRRPAARKSEAQPELDFLPPSVAPRTLKTKVQASIFCDAPVATLTHRAFAGAIDFSLTLIGYGLCLAAYSFMGGEFPVNRFGYFAFGAAFAFLALFYGLVWALANIETPGMRWTSLRLTNFDGFTPEPRQRLWRYLATTLSFATCGFGLLWALLDEESLTWQDHISKTFPTFQGR